MLQLDNAPLFASQLKDWVNTHFTLLPDSIRQNIISTVANLIGMTGILSIGEINPDNNTAGI